MIRIWSQQGIFIAVAFVCSVVLLGCSGDSAEGTVRSVGGLVVEGFYVHPTPGNLLVGQTSGAPVRSLNLRQSGDQLEGVDNNNIFFKGTIGQVIDGNRASFNLEGRSTIGERATISGIIDLTGNLATMRGTWIEPTLTSTVVGVAEVPENVAAVRLNPTSITIVDGGLTTFTASGGTKDFE